MTIPRNRLTRSRIVKEMFEDYVRYCARAMLYQFAAEFGIQNFVQKVGFSQESVAGKNVTERVARLTQQQPMAVEMAFKETGYSGEIEVRVGDFVYDTVFDYFLSAPDGRPHPATVAKVVMEKVRDNLGSG